MRYLRLSFWFLIGIVAVLAIAGLLAGTVFEDDIKQVFIAELNKSLTVPVELEQENISISVFRDFPDASVSFEDVRVRDNTGDPDAYLAEVGRIALRFAPLELLQGRYTVRRIDIEEGSLKLHKDRRGNPNWIIWKANEDSTAKALNLTLEEFKLQNIDLLYDDRAERHFIDVNVQQGLAQAELFQAENEEARSGFALNLSTSLKPERITIGGQDWPAEDELSLEASLQGSEGRINLEEALINLDGNRFALKGEIQTSGTPSVDLQVSGQQLKTHDLMALASSGSGQSNLTQFDSRGIVELSGVIKGALNSRLGPEIDLAFVLTRGSLSHPSVGVNLKDMSFSGRLESGSESSLVLENIVASQDGRTIEANLSIDDLGNPSIDLRANGRVGLATLVAFLPGDQFSDAKGHVEMRNLELRGKLSGFREGGASLAEGLLSFDNASWRWNGEKIAIAKGDFSLTGDRVDVVGLQVDGLGSSAEINATAHGLLAAILLGEEAPAPRLDGKLEAASFDLASILQTANQSVDTELEGEIEGRGFRLPRIRGKLEASFERFEHQDILFEKLTASLDFDPAFIDIKECRTEAMAGYLRLGGSLRQHPSGKIVLETSGRLEALDVEEVFRQFHNFGQSELTDRHLRGTMYGQLAFLEASWTPHLQFLEEEFRMVSDVEVRDGALIAYAPVEALAGFIRVEELRNIKFSSLNNRIRIEDRTIHVPVMDVNSSAINLDLSGTHSFDNEVDYQVRVNMMDILQRKFSKRNKDKSFMEQSKEGGLNVYVSMIGPAAAPEMSYNKKDARQKFKQADREQEGSDLGSQGLEASPGYPPEIQFEGEDENEDLPVHESEPLILPSDRLPEDPGSEEEDLDFMDWDSDDDG